MPRMRSPAMAHKGMQDQAMAIGLIGQDGERIANFLKKVVDVDGHRQGRVTGCCVANVGAAKDLVKGDYRIISSYLSVNEIVFGHSCFLSSCSVGNSLFLTLGTVAPLISLASAQRILDETTSLLEDAQCGDCSLRSLGKQN